MIGNGVYTTRIEDGSISRVPETISMRNDERYTYFSIVVAHGVGIIIMEERTIYYCFFGKCI
jgi:hypothetical protein